MSEYSRLLDNETLIADITNTSEIFWRSFYHVIGLLAPELQSESCLTALSSTKDQDSAMFRDVFSEISAEQQVAFSAGGLLSLRLISNSIDEYLGSCLSKMSFVRPEVIIFAAMLYGVMGRMLDGISSQL